MSTALRPRDSLGYQVNLLARLLEQALRDRIAVHGVVPGQFAQLLTLFEEEPLTQRELCDRVRIEQPTMAATLQRMDRDGLIERAPDPGDGRRVQITLSARARELAGPLSEAAREVNDRATRGLDVAEMATLMALVKQVVANLGGDG